MARVGGSIADSDGFARDVVRRFEADHSCFAMVVRAYQEFRQRNAGRDKYIAVVVPAGNDHDSVCNALSTFLDVMGNSRLPIADVPFDIHLYFDSGKQEEILSVQQLAVAIAKSELLERISDDRDKITHWCELLLAMGASDYTSGWYGQTKANYKHMLRLSCLTRTHDGEGLTSERGWFTFVALVYILGSVKKDVKNFFERVLGRKVTDVVADAEEIIEKRCGTDAGAVGLLDDMRGDVGNTSETKCIPQREQLGLKWRHFLLAFLLWRTTSQPHEPIELLTLGSGYYGYFKLAGTNYIMPIQLGETDIFRARLEAILGANAVDDEDDGDWMPAVRSSRVRRGGGASREAKRARMEGRPASDDSGEEDEWSSCSPDEDDESATSSSDESDVESADGSESMV